MTHYDDRPKGSSARGAALPAAIAAAIGATGVIAIALGFAGGKLLTKPETVEVTRDPSAAEIAEVCEPKVEVVQDELTAAQAKVAELERTSAEKEGQVQALEAKIARGAEAGKAIREELAAVKAELEQTKALLVEAQAEKERLLEDLRVTEEKLEMTEAQLVETRGQRDDAREDALFNRWQDFLGDAQLEICDKGNRKKLGNCRETVLATVGTADFRGRYAHCIRSGQAAPSVHELLKDADLPQYSSMIDEEAKQVKGWYVAFCDPTLPELEDAHLAEGRIPTSTPNAG